MRVIEVAADTGHPVALFCRVGGEINASYAHRRRRIKRRAANDALEPRKAAYAKSPKPALDQPPASIWFGGPSHAGHYAAKPND